MAHYIDRDALAAEIEKRIKNLHELGNDDFLKRYYEEQYGCINAYKSIVSFLDTLEVKEINEHKSCTTDE